MDNNMDRDLMLMSLMLKGLEIIQLNPTPQYDNLKKTFESEIKTIKTRMKNSFDKKKSAQQKAKMTESDKQVIIDELLGILGGEFGGVQTYSPNPSVTKFFGDYIKSAWNLDDEQDIIQKKKDDLLNIKKWNKDNWESF